MIATKTEKLLVEAEYIDGNSAEPEHAPFADREIAIDFARQLYRANRGKLASIVLVDCNTGEIETVWKRPCLAADLPAGYYAVDSKRYHVRRGSKGKWKGWTFIATGSDYHDQSTIAMVTPHNQVVRASEHGKRIVEELCKNPIDRVAEYGRITGTCGVCGRKLEDPESVARGIGPVCMGKF